MMHTIEIGFTDIQIETNMKTINFERFEIYTNVTMQNCITRDIREDFADTIMQNLNRARGYALMMKVIQSNGETEFSDEEIALIKFVADNYGNISLSMSIDKNIKELNNNETRKEEQQ